MKADDVARYLKENPVFFEDYADLLSQIFLPHPHGGRAIPISERQVLTLREKSKALEAKLAELIQFGEENDAIGAKIHRLCLALLGAKELDTMLSVLYLHLREDFAVPHAALRVWLRSEGEMPGETDRPEFGPVSESLREYAHKLTQPFCGPSGIAEAAAWFGEGASHVRSVAHMPLAGGRCFGMLALGSEDVLRFYPEMGTLYLTRLGELVSAALGRFR